MRTRCTHRGPLRPWASKGCIKACAHAKGLDATPAFAAPPGYLRACARVHSHTHTHRIERLPNGTFLHRKGAAPSHPSSLSLLPGSRATASYILLCAGTEARDLCSVAHGAGRRLSRADARRRAPPSDPTRGGTVVCGDRWVSLRAPQDGCFSSLVGLSLRSSLDGSFCALLSGWIFLCARQWMVVSVSSSEPTRRELSWLENFHLLSVK